MEGSLFISMISIIGLLLISSFSFLIAKKLKIPYTIFVFLIGVFIFFAKDIIPIFTHINGLKLTGDLIFYIFLPILIFESAYNIPYKKIVNDAIPIMSLAIFGLIISTTIIAFSLKFGLSFLFGIEIPLILSLLFGSIISATDPIAVIAIFKELGVPKRIAYIFEGESLMNDATSIALFLIILEIVQTGIFNAQSFFTGIGIFSGMLLWGIMWGLFIGGLFSKLIQKISDTHIEITFILLLAHIAFISSEMISEYFTNISLETGNSFFLFLQISPIIATTISAITLGNYGRYKISPKVEVIGNHFYEYFSFIANSLIFLLMGLLIGEYVDLISQNILPILLAIVVVVISRFISVFGALIPLNLFLKKENKVPNSWIRLLGYGSLRGAVAITMVLITPKDINFKGWDIEKIGMSPYEFLAVFVVSCILFTLFFKALSISKIIKKMGLTNLSKEDEYTMHQVKDLIDKKMIDLLKRLKSQSYVIPSIVNNLKQKYINDEKHEEKCVDEIKLSKSSFKNIIKRYALGIERNTIITSFSNKETDELSLKIILNKIENQYIRLEKGMPQLRIDENWFDKKMKKLHGFINHRNNHDKKIKHKFLFYRARAITALSVINELKNLREHFYNVDCKVLNEVIEKYEKWYKDANNKKINYLNAHRKELFEVEKNVIDNQIIYKEKMLLKNFYKKHILNSKTYLILKRKLID